MANKGSWYEAPRVLHREKPDPELLRALVFSLAGHLLLIGVVVALGSGRSEPISIHAYRVGLASAPADSKILEVGPLGHRYSATPVSKPASKTAPKPPPKKVEAKPKPAPKPPPKKAGAKPKPAPKPPPKKAEAQPKPADKAQAEPAAKTQAKPSPTTGKAAGEPRAGTPAPATSGSGSSGGGAVVRDAAFVRYYNLMIDAIRQHWVWVGSERDNLSVTVRFAVAPDGTIQGVRRTSSSGNPHFDQSVENAVRSVGRLEPPPVKYRRDFADVELIFRASDLARR